MKHNGKTYEQVFDDHADVINKQSKAIQKIVTRLNVLTLENEKMQARVNDLQAQMNAKPKGPFDDLLKGFGK